MIYIHYILKSFQVFIIYFFLGTFIDSYFKKLENQTPNIPYIIFSLLQLFTLISLTFILHKMQFLHSYFENYSPTLLFSSFLIGLQSNMINNFKNYFNITS